MRVISGAAGGLALISPKGARVRPTQDRVREAIFSMLGEAVVDARVLDLFAGTGALGIEALSRGAREAVFVERDARCAEVIRANLKATRLEAGAAVVRGDAMGYLGRALGREAFDLVFADPPYDKGPGCEAPDPGALGAAAGAVLGPGGLLVVEHFARGKAAVVAGLELMRERSYGETGVALYRAGSG